MGRSRQVAEFAKTRRLALPPKILTSLRERYSAQSASDEETLSAMQRMHTRHGRLIDPHTAVAWAVAERIETDAPVVVLSTAHPAKFPDAVKRACGVEPEMPERLRALFDLPERCDASPRRMPPRCARSWSPASKTCTLPRLTRGQMKPQGRTKLARDPLAARRRADRGMQLVVEGAVSRKRRAAPCAAAGRPRAPPRSNSRSRGVAPMSALASGERVGAVASRSTRRSASRRGHRRRRRCRRNRNRSGRSSVRP